MIELAGSTRFGQKAQRCVFIRQQVWVDDLNGNGSAKYALLGAIDSPHSTNADQIQYVIAAWQRLPDESVFTWRSQRSNWKTASRTVLVSRRTGGTALWTGADL